MEISNQNLRRYRENGFAQIQGWCNPQVFNTVDLFDSAPINKTGGVCEIGVHHGKLYLLLNQVTAPEATSYAIDVFDAQRLNIDKSGAGDRKIFERNLTEFDAHKGRNTQIISGDSTDSGLQLAKTIEPGSLRFFSVDGGHSAEHTISDLKIASQLVANEGVVILDDACKIASETEDRHLSRAFACSDVGPRQFARGPACLAVSVSVTALHT